MRVTHIAGPQQADVSVALPSGGLERFLEELVPAQERLGLRTDIRRVPISALQAATDAITRRDWKEVGKVGATTFGDIEADVIHVHDWHGATALEHLYRRGHRAFVMTSHLPLRRGFTY